MKYKVGDKVRVRSKGWHDKTKSRYGDIECGNYMFYQTMSHWCSEIITIAIVFDAFYKIKEDNGMFKWTDEMIECKVEDETKPEPKFKIGDKVKWFNHTCNITSIGTDENTYIYLIKHDDYREDKTFAKWVPETELTFEGDEETKPMTYEDTVEIIETMQGIGDSWECPQGYQFVDENGNVINATKIVLEKKGKEYPKTYEECCEVLDIIDNKPIWHGYRSVQLKIFQKLLICRDAYWKVGKPWTPQDTNTFSIFYDRLTGEIEKQDGYCGANTTLEFSTAEMRDAFYENFKELINSCKELL